MNSTDVINLFLLYQDYNLVYVNPFHELMKNLFHKMNEQEATEFFSKQEGVKKEILKEIEEYKQDFDFKRYVFDNTSKRKSVRK